VVGDIVKLYAGDRIPADCILLEESDMHVDERSIITTISESADSLIADRTNSKYSEKRCVTEDNIYENPDTVLLKDTLVMTGSGKAVVLSVGKHTLIEKEKID
jgi:magnesium-transporting ATPase (P-type)